MATKQAAKSSSRKVVPAKPKPAKKTAAKKTPAKSAAKKETALAVAEKPQVVSIKPGETPESGFSDSFKKKAMALHTKIKGTVERIGKDVVMLGELCLEMKDKAYYTVLGYKTSVEYFDAELPAGIGKTQAFQAMKIVRELTGGEEPKVTKDDINGMTKENAEGLAKLASRKVHITAEMIDQAKTMPIKRFQEEIVLPNAPDIAQRQAADRGTTLASAPSILCKMTLEMPSELLAERNRCLEIARWLVRDDDRSVPLNEKAEYAIYGEFRTTYEAEYESWLAEEATKAQHTAEHTDAHLPPDEAEVEEEILDEVEEEPEGESHEEVDLDNEPEPEDERIIEQDEYSEAPVIE